jgi:hypothetical protein
MEQGRKKIPLSEEKEVALKGTKAVAVFIKELDLDLNRHLGVSAMERVRLAAIVKLMYVSFHLSVALSNFDIIFVFR